MGHTLNLFVWCEKNPNFVSKKSLCHVTDTVCSLRQGPADLLCKTLTNTTIIVTIMITNKDNIYKTATQSSLIPGGSC